MRGVARESCRAGAARDRQRCAWEDPRLRQLAQAAEQVAIVDADVLGQVGTLESPAPIAFLIPLAERVDASAGEPTLVLDRLQDPGNVGSVLRSAAAFGFTQAVALTERRRYGRPRPFVPAWGRTSVCASSRAPTSGARCARRAVVRHQRTPSEPSTPSSSPGPAPGRSATRARASPPRSRRAAGRCWRSRSREAANRSTSRRRRRPPYVPARHG